MTRLTTARTSLIIAAAALIASAAPVLARTMSTETTVPESVIMAGPIPTQSESDTSAGIANAQAELDYLNKVCPTVLSHPNQAYPGNLVEFCQEPHG